MSRTQIAKIVVSFAFVFIASTANALALKTTGTPSTPTPPAPGESPIRFYESEPGRYTIPVLQESDATGPHPRLPVLTELTGSIRWVTILCRFADSTDVTPHDPSWYEGLMGSEFPGMDHYWREVSYGNINLEGSYVVGWYNLPDPREAYLHPDSPWDLVSLNKLAEDCTAAADADVYFPDFYGINIMYNDELLPPCSAWNGTRTLSRDGMTKTYASTFEAPSCQRPGVVAHEMGHGYGLPHSSGPYDETYDSMWDPMSNPNGLCASPHPVYECTGTHTIAFHKDMLGWIPPERKFTAEMGTSTTINLERVSQPSPGSSYLMAEIPLGNSPTYFYTVEARRFAGFDNNIPGEAVVIHEVDLTRFPTNGDTRNGDRVARVVDIDGNGNPNDAAAMWTPGETFTDATYGISIAVDAATESGFMVTITVDPMSPFTGCQNQSHLAEADCEALVALYNSTDGHNWSEKWGWLENSWPCLWYGVRCEDGHVTKVELSANELSGSLPAEFGALTHLQTLDLSWNHLSGPIPNQWQSLTALRELFLGDNQLTGPVPAWLSNLTILERVILWTNQLSGEIPTNLRALPNLWELQLNNNQLSGPIPPELGNLTNLIDLGLFGNQLNGTIPPQLGNLQNLVALYLGGNQLTGNIPPELGNLTVYLKYLYLQDAQLTGNIPPELGNATNLLQLYVHNNPLEGSLPLELTKLTNLTTFWFNATSLCEPSDPEFQGWLAAIPDLNRTAITCGTSFLYLPNLRNHRP